MDNRKFPRFDISLGVEAKNTTRESSFGQIKNFSRQGARVCLDKLDLEPHSTVELKIQRPNKNVFIPAMGLVMWKKETAGKWEVGVKLLDFPPEVKVEILEYAYQNWLRSVNRPRVS